MSSGSSSSSTNLVLSGAAYNNFVDTIKSDQTREQYKRCLVRFMRFLNITDIDNLMALVTGDGTVLDSKALQKIIDYIGFLKRERRLGANAINLYLSPIIHFYAMNDITLNRKKIGRYVPVNIRKHNDRTYTREEVTRLLEFCDLRDRSIVLLFASTGMRIGAIPDLRLEHLTKIENYSLYQITVYQGHPEEYITFCTPECRNAIDNYLNYRERCGEILAPKSPLFREQFDVNDLEQIRKKAKTIVENTITKMLGKKLHLAGIIQIEQLKEGEDPTKKRKAVMRSHGFRKFVNTTMINCRIDSSIRNKLLGHSIALDKSYWRPQVNDLLQEYLKCVDALTINEEFRLRRENEMLKVNKLDIQQLKEQVEEFKTFKSEIKEHDKRVEEYYKRIMESQKAFDELGNILKSNNFDSKKDKEQKVQEYWTRFLEKNEDASRTVLDIGEMPFKSTRLFGKKWSDVSTS